MSQETPIPSPSLIPPQTIPAQARTFSKTLHGLLDGQPKDEATVAKALDGQDETLDLIAAKFYSLASMLVGEGEESVQLLEAAIANAEVSLCDDPALARKNGRRALSIAALERLAERNPASLAAPQGLQPVATCIEDDDLAEAGISSDELEQMMGGPDRDRVRNWLTSLPVDLRTVFALRAVAGIPSTETAELLKAHGGPQAAGWTAEAVREVFRQGLCSLASQLIHATTAR
jgi:hypothetical protein